MNVFIDTEDRHISLELLREYTCRHQVDVWDYVLMTNHTHLIVVPRTQTSLSAALRDTHGAYAGIFNRKYGFIGHLWQARFTRAFSMKIASGMRFDTSKGIRFAPASSAELKTIHGPVQVPMCSAKRIDTWTPDFRCSAQSPTGRHGLPIKTKMRLSQPFARQRPLAVLAVRKTLSEV